MDSPKKEGLRDRKRRETLQRIAEAGLRLFIANGYDATTLDAIAAAAGISRRTFFYYFKSKEEILLAWQSGFGEVLHATLLKQSPAQRPVDAVCSALLSMASGYQTEEVLAIDRLMRSNSTLMARKQASYLSQELALFEALCELWPQPARRAGLRLVAMASIGTMRLALETWSQEGGEGEVQDYLRLAFAALKAEI